MNITNTYLHRLYRADKGLFVVVVLLVLGTLYYSLRQREEFPFLLYGMYSLKEVPQEDYETYTTVIFYALMKDTKLTDTRKELMTTPISHVAELYKAGKLSPQQGKEFNLWLYSLYKHHIDTLKPTQVQLLEFKSQYKADGSAELTHMQLLYGEDTQYYEN